MQYINVCGSTYLVGMVVSGELMIMGWAVPKMVKEVLAEESCLSVLKQS